MVYQRQTRKLNSLKLKIGYFPYRILRGVLISSGKKRLADRLISDLFHHIRVVYRIHPIIFLHIFFEKIRPKVAIFSKKIAGINYKIPTPITYRKSVAILIHWWLLSARKHSRGKDFYSSFTAELDDSYKNSFSFIAKKRDEVHRLAHMNRPFLRYIKLLQVLLKI